MKLTWEVGRFPHAYHVARAAAFAPSQRDDLASGLLTQLETFVTANPFGRGVHWASGQEIVFRLMAWVFAFEVLLSRTAHREQAVGLIGTSLLQGAAHVEAHIDYARFAVYNNHLLSEALGLFLAGTLLEEASAAVGWRVRGRSILEEEADRQFYGDGGYIQQSHNYHRVALHDLLWACLVARAGGEPPATSWLKAMERSVDFLVAHQNPSDGRLPNYGANDGGMPSLLSTCDFSDFRPTLQAASLASRGERLYPPGPWDEEAAWFLGPRALVAPLRRPDRRSFSFAETGFHVLRRRESSSFCAFRCGSLRDRFSQMDMLHVDVWWRGLNVLVDGGSYLYNGPAEWHNHFMRTASHNTVVVGGWDQMLHHRKFKALYWTKARLLDLRADDAWSLVVGEHYGYQRRPGRCVHRRAVLSVGDDLWVVADTVEGRGSSTARLHWLCGDFPHSFGEPTGPLCLDTTEGPFSLTVYDVKGSALAGDVARGQASPPRGWLSRYYGVKTPVPSLAVEQTGTPPLTFLSVFGAGQPTLAISGDGLEAHGDKGGVRFSLEKGITTKVEIA